MNMYFADVIGQEWNCLYPHKQEITDDASLAKAVSRDYVCAEYKGGYRSKENFVRSDCVAVEFDNDHSENPEDWITPAKVKAELPGVEMAFHFSRHHMREKRGKPARPKFHMMAAIEPIYNDAEYAALKQKIAATLPFVDPNALDAARFFYGTEEPLVEYVPGTMTLTEFLADEEDFDAGMAQGEYGGNRVITEGRRNATMSRHAGKLVKRYGYTEEAHQLFLQEAEKCDPPLDDAELDKIWHSAARTVKWAQQQPGYIPPEEFNSIGNLKPDDYSDIGQAKVIATDCGSEIVFTPGTDFCRFTGKRWEESKPKALGLVIEFLDRQLEDAIRNLERAKKRMTDLGVSESAIAAGGKTLEKEVPNNALEALFAFISALNYKAFVMKRRDMKYITSAMQALKPMVEVDQNELDRNENLLNCPDGTYDLRQGMRGKRDHDASDLITKITPYAPGDQGKQEFLIIRIGVSTASDRFMLQILLAVIPPKDGRNATAFFIEKIQESRLSNVEQSASDFKVEITRSVAEQVADVAGDVDGLAEEIAGFKDTVTGYMDFNGDSLAIGVVGSSFKTEITNTEMAFTENGEKVAYVSNNDMYITRARVTDTLSVGTVDNGYFDFVTLPGGLALKWRDAATS